jgi:hypothetical protein
VLAEGPGGYPNVLGADDSKQIPFAYGSNAERLMAAKKRFDQDEGFSSATPLLINQIARVVQEVDRIQKQPAVRKPRSPFGIHGLSQRRIPRMVEKLAQILCRELLSR